ncbi:MXAN_6230/SCO0854 family RING domain-containing protein [Streptomyces sp. PvR034]|uniref:MXAN_6230/SCO0854 family RING domain-containing protein n=1 Tax=Streptomyces sp. PvR034 TaxID=3156401 RepID=UPI0033929E5B
MTTVESVLLRRTQTVYVDPVPGWAPDGRPALRRLEAALLERGHVLRPELYAALAALPAEALADVRRDLVALIDDLLGADRTHTPLLRRFPSIVRGVVRDTDRLYVDRVFAHLLQQADHPCVLCGEQRTVFPVSPCAHLVCRLCWDGADYSGCPLCHRRIDPADPFLHPVRPTAGAEPVRRGPLRLLGLGTDRAADAGRIVLTLLARRTPLSPQDREDLLVLLPLSPAARGDLPAEIPVRETKALVLGTLLAGSETREAGRALLAERLTTATDVLRLLAVLSSGDPGLLPLPPRFVSVGRPLRRALLAVLDALPTPYVVEDLLRHPTAWKRAAEVLHPFERHARHPRAALAFAALRGTPLTGPLGASLRESAAAHPDAVRIDPDGSRIRPATWGHRMEGTLAQGAPGAAAAVAGQRPGELVRRLDHLMRLHDGDHPVPELARALEHGLPAVGPGPLLSALGALRVRAEDRLGTRRVFFPRGEVTRALSVAEARPPLPEPLVRDVVGLLEDEVLRRFARPEERPYDVAVIDSGLGDLAVPFAERDSARSLVAVPRGSTVALPPGEVLRLFLHWTEPLGHRTDLDLSVAFFDADWRFTGQCDYTRLAHGPAGAAVHSGDLTSAPAPDGATEYVDLDLTKLAAHGDAYAVALVFSYNNVPFDELPDAFAGFMTLAADGPRDARYDPRTVRQRFDLAGRSRAYLPMVVDLGAREALWADVHLPPSTSFQSVDASGGEQLGAAARDLRAHFGSGTRTTLWDLAVWRSAARTREVAVLRRAPLPGALDELWLYRAAAGEEPAAFAARIAALDAPQERRPHADADGAAAELAAGKHAFLALTRASVAPQGGSGTAYRLFPGPAEVPAGFARVSAGDLVAELG